MARQLYYEDVQPNDEIPTIVKHPTTEQLVRWAGAADDYYPIHYDKDFAQSVGMPTVIAHGWLVASFLAQMLTDWIGELGELKKFSCHRFNVPVFPGDDVICKGKVIRKYVQKNEYYVECEIWIENGKGITVIPGSAIVTLPSGG